MLALALALSLVTGQVGVRLYDEGSLLGPVTQLDCVGAGIVCSLLTTGSVRGILTISTGGGSAYATVQDEGTPLTQRATVNFVGAGVSCADSGGITVCTIAGGGGGGESPFIRILGSL